MGKEPLKRWRLLIPGIIILIYILPGLTSTKQELLNLKALFITFKWSDLIYLAVIIILGAIYYALNLRWLVWRHYNEKVTENIKDYLLNMCSVSLESNKWYWLKKDRTLLNVFYKFIDNDESLKDKANDVRFNGLIWSTCFDLAILSSIGGFVYFLISMFSNRDYLIYVSVILFIVYYVAICFCSLLTYRHIKLSNEQLEIIEQRYLSDVRTEINNVLSNCCV